ncbi:MAG: glycoside hydrolase family 16, partial [Parcubacteria group bacterium Gr01-1014_66]
MSHLCTNGSSWKSIFFFAGGVVLLFFPVLPAGAAINAPILQDPASACSGIDAYVTLNWSTVENATSYEILRNGTPLQTVPTTTYDDHAVSATETYTYAVVAKNSVETSAPSQAKNIIVDRCGTTLSSPGSTCQAQGQGPEITLSWEQIAGASSYVVYRDTTFLIRVPSTVNSYQDTTNLKGAVPYTYFVKTEWSDGTRKDSKDLPITAAACAPLLDGNASCGVTNPGVNLSWNSLPGITEYQIIKKGAFFDTTDQTKFLDTKIQQRETYEYQIRARFGETASADSNTKSLLVPRCAPVVTAQSACSPNNPILPQVLLSWTSTAEATQYNIEEPNHTDGFVAQQSGS